MNIAGYVVGALGHGPLLTPHDKAVARRRSMAIHGYIGPNGSGKSLLAATDTIPTLMGIPWACENPDHLHTMEGQTTGLRRVLSTMPFITPSGAPHPLYDALTDFGQITSAEHCDLILDEVGGAVASSTTDNIPMSVKASLQELRRRDVSCRWTAPSWKRAANILRECSQGVTLSVAGMAVPHRDGIHFDGPHETEQLTRDRETLEKIICPTEGPHSHDAGRLWGARRLMYARTFDANLMDEWTNGKREKLRPVVRELFWRPGSDAESVYDTHAYVEKLGQVTEHGACDQCGGTRRRKACECEKLSPSQRRKAAADAARVALAEPDHDHDHEHEPEIVDITPGVQ